MPSFTESTIEQAALDWLASLGYTLVYGGDIGHGNTLASLRDSLLPKLTRGEVRVSPQPKFAN
jgi:hypothetical protein